MASPNLRRLCFEKHGHEYPEELNTDQQYMLLMMDRSREMYGHTSVGQLTDDEFASVLDADEVVAALEGLAQAQEAEGEEMDSQDTASDTNEEENEEEEEEEEDTEDDQDQIMRNLYERIDQLMAQPTFPLDSVDELLNLFPEGEMGEAPVPNPTPARTVTNSPSVASEAGGSSRSGSGSGSGSGNEFGSLAPKKPRGNLFQFKFSGTSGGGGPGSPHGTPSSSSNSDNEGDSRDSSAPSATGSPGPSDDEDSEQLPASSSPFLSDAGTPPADHQNQRRPQTAAPRCHTASRPVHLPPSATLQSPGR
ncbi:hypothetical protein NUW58_g10767 [Xylaria curta]|uniref:Uncharacterized protein n=1 Tax=Xylaria curta TaxID=42375 RepID=A0ACC1MIG3_9PEZI|nr:hypothetical protein NUW58_g10767 [Xylaria curta]